jgi:hypothetical protein
MPIGNNLVIPTVLAFFVILAIVAMATRAGRTRRPLLSPLTSEARDRYAARWDQIESRFVEAPEEAVDQADALVLAILGECDHPLAEKKLPDRMRKARREASRGGTERLRVAMLDYRGVIQETARETEPLTPAREGRRETA